MALYLFFKAGRRLPPAGRTTTSPQFNLTGREAEIQALMSRNRSSPAFQNHGESKSSISLSSPLTCLHHLPGKVFRQSKKLSSLNKNNIKVFVQGIHFIVT